MKLNVSGSFTISQRPQDLSKRNSYGNHLEQGDWARDLQARSSQSRVRTPVLRDDCRLKGRAQPARGRLRSQRDSAGMWPCHAAGEGWDLGTWRGVVVPHTSGRPQLSPRHGEGPSGCVEPDSLEGPTDTHVGAVPPKLSAPLWLRSFLVAIPTHKGVIDPPGQRLTWDSGGKTARVSKGDKPSSWFGHLLTVAVQWKQVPQREYSEVLERAQELKA